MKDFKLDSAHDLAIENGDLTFVEDNEEIKQNIPLRLYWIQGEWYYNRGLGIPWFSKIFKLNVSPVAKREFIVQAIQSIPGVRSIKKLEQTIEGRAGALAIQVETDYSTVEDISI